MDELSQLDSNHEEMLKKVFRDQEYARRQTERVPAYKLTDQGCIVPVFVDLQWPAHDQYSPWCGAFTCECYEKNHPAFLHLIDRLDHHLITGKEASLIYAGRADLYPGRPESVNLSPVDSLE